MESVPSDSPAGTRLSYRRRRPLSTTTALDASSIGADVSSFSPKASTSTLPDNDISIISSSHGGTRRLLELRAHTLGSSGTIGGGPDISGSSSSHKKRPRNARDFPPHLAAALGPTAFDPDNGDLVLDDDEYEQRKMEWAKRYTDVETLRDTFGTNRNQLWGDLDPETTRRLYHTLLPRALMGLYDMGLMRPHELAPLAYEARNAAKKYARERCIVPGRVFSMAYDGFRSLRDYGQWNSDGLSWEQVWDKYEQQIIDEFDFEDDEDDELTKQICLRILESSCRTNAALDKLLLKNVAGAAATDELAEEEDDDDAIAKRTQERMEMAEISAKIEHDVHDLLFEGAQKSRFFDPTREQKKRLKARKKEIRKAVKTAVKKERVAEKSFVKALKEEDKLEKLKRKAAERRAKKKRRNSISPSSNTHEDVCDVESDLDLNQDKKVKLKPSEIWLLRKLVGTKKRIRALQSQTPLIKKIHDDDSGGTIITASSCDPDDRECHQKEYGEALIEVSPRAKSLKRPWLNRGRALPERETETTEDRK